MHARAADINPVYIIYNKICAKYQNIVLFSGPNCGYARERSSVLGAIPVCECETQT